MAEVVREGDVYRWVEAELGQIAPGGHGP
jgi:hypothetical protein